MVDIKTTIVPGKAAIEQLELLRAKYQENAMYPCLFGGERDFERIETGVDSCGESSDAIMEKARKIEPPNWFQKEFDLSPKLYSVDESDWPEDEQVASGLVTHLDVLSRKPLKEVFIGLLKVDSPTELFAHLKWGGWNDCPSPEVHVALHRYWEAKYGSEVVSITRDVVQCVVSRPPVNKADALTLAREHYAYCPDIVDQGFDSISVLASALRNANTWFFWWD